MKRDTLEKVTGSMVVIFTSVFALGVIIIAANLIFQWDIFPPFMEKVVYFVALALFIVILCAAVINIMLNVSRLAYFTENIARKFVEGSKKNA